VHRCIRNCHLSSFRSFTPVRLPVLFSWYRCGGEELKARHGWQDVQHHNGDERPHGTARTEQPRDIRTHHVRSLTGLTGIIARLGNVHKYLTVDSGMIKASDLATKGLSLSGPVIVQSFVVYSPPLPTHYHSHYPYTTLPPRPTQPPILTGTRNEYQPKGGCRV